MLDKIFRENQNTHFYVQWHSPPPLTKKNSCPLWLNVDKYGTAEQATDGDITWWMRFAPTFRKNFNYLLFFIQQQCLREGVNVDTLIWKKYCQITIF